GHYPARRAAAGQARAQSRRARLHGGARAACPADVGEGIHSDASLPVRAAQVTRLITEVLAGSRLESGRMEVKRQLVDVPERARKIIAGRVASGEAEDRFRLEAAPDLPATWLDAAKIDQILGNLVENAVRHGAGIVSVMVRRAPVSGDQAEAITVSVRDEGEGIPPEIALRVFRQFWRGKRRGGTGLGLYIVKGLIEAMNGEIAVARAP